MISLRFNPFSATSRLFHPAHFVATAGEYRGRILADLPRSEVYSVMRNPLAHPLVQKAAQVLAVEAAGRRKYAEEIAERGRRDWSQAEIDRGARV